MRLQQYTGSGSKVVEYIDNDSMASCNHISTPNKATKHYSLIGPNILIPVFIFMREPFL